MFATKTKIAVVVLLALALGGTGSAVLRPGAAQVEAAESQRDSAASTDPVAPLSQNTREDLDPERLWQRNNLGLGNRALAETDPNTAQPEGTGTRSAREVHFLQSPDGKLVVVLATGGVLAFEAMNGRQLWKTQVSGAQSLAFSRDGKTITVSAPEEIRYLESATGKLVGLEMIQKPKAGTTARPEDSLHGLLKANDPEIRRLAAELLLRLKRQAEQEKAGTGARPAKPILQAPPANPASLIEATVIGADPSGLYAISAGTAAGLTRGQLLDVYRLKPEPKYLGRVRIIEIGDKEAIAQPAGRLLAPIQQGDRVTTKISAHPEPAKTPAPPSGDLEKKLDRLLREVEELRREIQQRP